ncbi:MAG: hypothetical protein AAB922_01680 [Patescibacteria group bacterium]
MPKVNLSHEVVTTSPRFSLMSEDVVSLLKGLAITMAGAGLTYLTEYVGKMSFGQYTPIIVAMFSLVVNVIRKWLTEKRYIGK